MAPNHYDKITHENKVEALLCPTIKHLNSVMRLKIWAYLCENCCKQEFSKEALFCYNLNTKGALIFPNDDKQFVLLTSMGNNNPQLQYTGKNNP